MIVVVVVFAVVAVVAALVVVVVRIDSGLPSATEPLCGHHKVCMLSSIQSSKDMIMLRSYHVKQGLSQGTAFRQGSRRDDALWHGVDGLTPSMHDDAVFDNQAPVGMMDKPGGYRVDSSRSSQDPMMPCRVEHRSA